MISSVIPSHKSHFEQPFQNRIFYKFSFLTSQKSAGWDFRYAQPGFRCISILAEDGRLNFNSGLSPWPRDEGTISTIEIQVNSGTLFGAPYQTS